MRKLVSSYPQCKLLCVFFVVVNFLKGERDISHHIEKQAKGAARFFKERTSARRQ
jgi:hypothetical protein